MYLIHILDSIFTFRLNRTELHHIVQTSLPTGVVLHRSIGTPEQLQWFVPLHFWTKKRDKKIVSALQKVFKKRITKQFHLTIQKSPLECTQKLVLHWNGIYSFSPSSFPLYQCLLFIEIYL
jgi:hypothetical protein